MNSTMIADSQQGCSIKQSMEMVTNQTAAISRHSYNVWGSNVQVSNFCKMRFGELFNIWHFMSCLAGLCFKWEWEGIEDEKEN